MSQGLLQYPGEWRAGHGCDAWDESAATGGRHSKFIRVDARNDRRERSAPLGPRVRPAETDGMTAAKLADLVTLKGLIGTALVWPQPTSQLGSPRPHEFQRLPYLEPLCMGFNHM
jgi:hypothetical protein